MKFLSIVSMLIIGTIFFAACSKSEQKIEPKRVAILSTAGLDIVDSLGVSDRVVGIPKESVDYLEKFYSDEKILKLDSEDSSSIIKCQPDLIILDVGNSNLESIKKIAPVISIQTRNINLKIVESNARAVAEIFGREKIVEDLISKYRQRIDESKRPDRVFISREIFTPMLADFGFESVKLDENPDYIFIVDRSDSLQFDFNLIKNSRAAQMNRVIYIDHSSTWIQATGGLHAFDVMLQDIERNLY